jgi:hypothetical protein
MSKVCTKARTFLAISLLTSANFVTASGAQPQTGNIAGPWTPTQYEAAREYGLSHQWLVGSGQFYQCGPLPSDKGMLDALKYADDDVPVNVPGLSHGLTSLPAGLLRRSYCISARPIRSNVRGFDNWYKQFFTVPREQAPVQEQKGVN